MLESANLGQSLVIAPVMIVVGKLIVMGDAGREINLLHTYVELNALVHIRHVRADVLEKVINV